MTRGVGASFSESLLVLYVLVNLALEASRIVVLECKSNL